MWAVALAAVAFPSTFAPPRPPAPQLNSPNIIFGYNGSTPTLGIDKIEVYYKSQEGTQTLVERNARNGFYKINLDNFTDTLLLPASYNKNLKWIKRPFLIENYASGDKIVSGFYQSSSTGIYFFPDSFANQFLILPQPNPEQTGTVFNIENDAITSNIVYTNFDASPGYAQNRGPCPNATADPRAASPCIEVSPDDIYGKGNAFMAYYYYSESQNISLKSFGEWLSGKYNNLLIPPITKSNVFCADPPGAIDYDIKYFTVQKIASNSSFCSAGLGYDLNYPLCDFFGPSGDLAYANGFVQLDAYVPSPDTRFSTPAIPNLECLPWSVIQEENVDYVLSGLSYGSGSGYDWATALLNATKDAGTGCQNFNIGGSTSDSMYCPVMWRPWQFFTIHTIVDPNDILTYTNSTNGQKYYFWVARCFNDNVKALDNAVDIFEKKLQSTCGSIPCSSGSYSNADTKNLCTPAPSGTYALGDHTAIVPCNASLFQYAHGEGNAECSNCTSVNSSTGASYQIHNNSKGWGVSCTSEFCLRGEFFNPTTELCQRCPNNTYTTNNISRNCLPCAGAGALLVMENGYAVGCQCVPGFGGLTAAERNESGTKQCEPCLTATYNDAYTDSREVCKTCVNSGSGGGSYPNHEHTTCVCQKGFSGPGGSGSSCKECGVGNYTNATGQPNCATCSAGTYQDERGGSTCIECISGTYSNSSGDGLCTQCQAGTATDPDIIPRLFYYASDGGKTECLPCSIGKYQDQKGEGGCLKCAAGTYAGSEGQSMCEACSAGTYQNEEKGASCTKCNAGEYQQDKGQSVCRECPKGSYSVETGSLGCVLCAKGRYQDQSEQTSCKECTGGTYQKQTAQPGCSVCIVGKYSGVGASSCTECERGKYQDNPGKSLCKDCAQGTYVDQRESTKCIECLPGKFQEEAGQTMCDSCPEGTYTDSADSTLSSCTPCSPGYYGNEQGATACKLCSLGAYSYGYGSLSCSVNKVNQRSVTPSQGSPPTFCRNNKNTHAPYNGLTECLKCYPGTFHPYSVGEKPKVCDLCPVGTYQDEFGSPDCKPCPSNQRGLAEGQYQCACAPGSYDAAKKDYPPQCERCGGQKYQDEVGSREGCKTCDNLYMPLPGHQGCVPVYEEVTDTCLMVFWKRECYSKGIHPITIGLWLLLLVFAYQFGKALLHESRHIILDSK